MRRPAVALCATLVLLAAAGEAGAHPTLVPTSVTAGQRGTVTFVAPNERQMRQTGFAVSVAPPLAIVAAGASDVGWRATVRRSTATWSGCCIPPGDVASFTLELQAADEPGDVQLEARQLYADGRVRWPLTLTVLPAREEASSALTVLLVAGLGLAITVGLVVLLWLRRAPTAPGSTS